MKSILLSTGKNAKIEIKKAIEEKRDHSIKDIKGCFSLNGKMVIIDLHKEFLEYNLSNHQELAKALEECSAKKSYWQSVSSSLNRAYSSKKMELDIQISRIRILLTKESKEKDKKLTKEDIVAKLDTQVNKYLNKVIGFGEDLELPEIRDTHPYYDKMKILINTKAELNELEEAKALISAVTEGYFDRSRNLSAIKDLVISFK